MIEGPTLVAYLVASAAIIVAPGPGQALVLARTLSDGRRAGIMTAAGLNVGTVIHAVAAALGLSALLAQSALLFEIVKYLGAAYLVVLGLQALRTSREDSGNRAPIAPGRSAGAFRRALITGLLNPKIALFFLAFLPQFVDPRRGSTFLQFLLLGSLLAAVDTVYESLLVLLAVKLRNTSLGSSRLGRWRERTTGGVLVGLGLRLALVRRAS